MSYTELHTGKLKIKHTDFSIEDFKNFLSQDEGLYTEDLDERLSDKEPFVEVRQGDWKGDLLFIYNKGTLYEVKEHRELSDAEYVDVTTKNGDEIDFTYLFYHGGTCFQEMLQEGLNKL